MICDKNCFECKFEDCIRDEREDTREYERYYYNKNRNRLRDYQKARYYNNIELARKYHRDYEKNHYDKEKNTEKCRKYRNKNIEKKRQYDRDRYLRKKAEVS